MLGDGYEIKKFRLNNIVLDSLDHLNNLLFKTFLYPWYGTRKTLSNANNKCIFLRCNFKTIYLRAQSGANL